jgi:hypothetical protein
MRYYIRKVGPGHAFGFGWVVGTVLALIPAFLVILVGALVPVLQAALSSLLGPLGQDLFVDSNASWWPTVLVALSIVILSGLLYGIGGWLLAVGYNLVARVTGGLALDLEQALNGSIELAAPWPQDMPASVGTGKEPTMRLPKPLPGDVQAPAEAFAVAARSAPKSQASGPSQAAKATEVKMTSKEQAWLIATTGTQETWGLSGEAIGIGRDAGNQVTIADDPMVEAFHAEIRVEPSGYVLYDLSQQGTWVNDRPIQNRNLLKDGFRIRVGQTEMVFRLLG